MSQLSDHTAKMRILQFWGVLIEHYLYWPDRRSPVIEATVERAHFVSSPRMKRDVVGISS